MRHSQLWHIAIQASMILLFACMFCFKLGAQKISIYDNYTKPPVQTKDTSHILISAAAFKKVVKNTFGQIATGQSNSAVLSNFASLDIAQGKFSFNGSVPLSSWCFITAELSGDIDNNISQLFTNYKINNNSSVNLRFHLRIPHGTKFFYTEDDKQKMDKERWKIHNQYRMDSSQIIADSAITEINLELYKLIRDSIKTRYEELDDSAKLSKNNYTYNADSAIKATNLVQFKVKSRDLLEIRKLLIEAQKKYDSVKYAFDKKNEYYQGLMTDAAKKRKAAIENLEINADWSAIRMQWLSARINPVRSKFWMMDTLQPYNRQVFDTAITNVFYGLEYSFYFYSRKNGNTHYFNIGVGYKKTDNRKDLDTYDVSDSWKRDSARLSRSYSSKVNAYNGLLTETVSWNIYGNYYFFLGNSNILGIHLFPDVELRDQYKPQYNLGGGLVFSFKKKGEEKTIINAEPYFRLVDITDALGKGSSVIKRNEIGIRIGLPFSPGAPKMKE